MFRKILLTLPIVLIAAIVPACEKGGSVIDPKDPVVTAIEGAPERVEVEPGEMARFNVTARVSGGSPAVYAQLSVVASVGQATISQTNTEGLASLTWKLPAGTRAATLQIRAGDKTLATVEGASTYAAAYVSGAENLTPGATARLKGYGFTGRLSSLTIGGRTVTANVTSDSTATFQVPLWHACDVDGRPIQIRAGEKAYSQTAVRLQVANPFSLPEVGDSRVIPLEQLGCLQFPANDESYLVTAINLNATWGNAEMAFRLRSISDTAAVLGGASAPAAARTASYAAQVPAGRTTYGHGDLSRFLPKIAPQRSSSAGFTPFDSNYATAQVGDTLTFVDWYGPDYGAWCFYPRSEIQTFQAVVLAAEGISVIVGDLRSQHIGGMTSAASLERYAKAARMVDKTVVPALRHVFYKEFEPRKEGANGRVFTVVGDIPQGWNAMGLITPDHLPNCNAASGMMTSYHHDAYWDREASTIASTAVHEFAHAAQSGYSNGSPHSVNYFYESFAVQAEETAARISIGTLEGASQNALYTHDHPDPRIVSAPWNRVLSRYPPWGFWGRDHIANYTAGGQFVLWMRDEVGETLVEAPERTLYQRILDTEPGPEGPDISTLMRFVDPSMTLAQMLEKYMLDWLLDDQLPPAAMQKLGIDGIAAWDNSTYVSHPGAWYQHYDSWLPRTGMYSPTEPIELGRAAYNYWVVPAEDSRGLSLLFSDVNTAANIKVRIIRVR